MSWHIDTHSYHNGRLTYLISQKLFRYFLPSAYASPFLHETLLCDTSADPHNQLIIRILIDSPLPLIKPPTYKINMQVMRNFYVEFYVEG